MCTQIVGREKEGREREREREMVKLECFSNKDSHSIRTCTYGFETTNGAIVKLLTSRPSHMHFYSP